MCIMDKNFRYLSSLSNRLPSPPAHSQQFLLVGWPSATPPNTWHARDHLRGLIARCGAPRWTRSRKSGDLERHRMVAGLLPKNWRPWRLPGDDATFATLREYQ